MAAQLFRKNCKLGAYAIILGPVEIGENSVIGAGAIVTHDVPPNTIYYNKIIAVRKPIDTNLSKGTE